MTLEITLGFWLIPSVVTIAAFIFAAWICRHDGSSTYAYFAGFLLMLAFGAAAIISLIAWLIWAVLT